MIFNQKHSKALIASLISLSLLLCAVLFKVSFIVGSKSTFFSAFGLLNPALMGSVGSPLLVTLIFAVRALFGGASLMTFLFRRIAGLAGAFYWGVTDCASGVSKRTNTSRKS